MISEAVWVLYQQALMRFGHVHALIEWDSDIPDFPVLLAQVHRAQVYQTEVLHGVYNGS